MNPKSALLVFLLPLCFAACSSVPAVRDPSGLDLDVRALSANQVMVYYGQGTDGDPNPYIPQSGLLSGLLASQKVDFVVLRMDIASLGPRHIAVTDAAAKDASGTVLARFYSEQDFLSMLKSYALDEQGFDSLKLRVEQSYMPDGGAQVKAGKRSYAVVLVGRHPLPKSLSVEADVDVEPGEPRVFHLQWAD